MLPANISQFQQKRATSDRDAWRGPDARRRTRINREREEYARSTHGRSHEIVVANQLLIGSLFFVGAAQFVLAMIIAEARYPGYSIADNAISDLGVGRTARLFNTSVIGFLLGALGGGADQYRTT